MHALLAHAYHLARPLIHLATLPIWRSLAAALAVSLGGRLALRHWLSGPALGGLAVLAGWAVMTLPGAGWPTTPVSRLTGLAAIVLVDAVLRAKGWRPWLATSASAALAAWWLRGAPLDAGSIAGCMPVFLALLAGFVLARRLAFADAGWGTLAAALTLAACLAVTGASPHWARAALVPAASALALLGVPEAMQVLAGLVVVLAGAALVASDRGRLLPVDAACLAPLLAWALVRRLVSRLVSRRAPHAGSYGPAMACVLAVLLCVALVRAILRLSLDPVG